MKKIIFMAIIIVALVFLTTVAIYAFIDLKNNQSNMSIEESIKTPVENKISESIPGQEHQSSFGIVKSGVVSEMIADIKESGTAIQNIQKVYSEFELKRALGVNGYGNIMPVNIALRSLYSINIRFPIEYINRIDEKTIYVVYKTTDEDNELQYMYLFFRKLDDQREGVQEETETWWLDGKVFFIKNTLQFSDFSNIKVESTISEVNAVDSMVNPEIGTDREYTKPFNSYHLLTDGALRIEYAFDETDGIYRVSDIDFVESFEIPITEDGEDSTICVKIDPKDYPPVN